MGTFLLGAMLTIGGGYLILNQVQITGGYWRWWGPNTFGLTLIPLMLGAGLLFFNGRSLAGWVLAAGGTVIILAGVIASMDMYFRQTSLFNVLLMLGLFVAGLGLMARSLR
jgi:multisubunit Na+/H+ antiporter MnhF subunit